MRVVIPYTARHLDTIAGAPEGAEWLFVGDDNEHYWRTMTGVWAKGGDLTIIEHDVVCRPDILATFEACPEPWCVVPYHNTCHPDPWTDAKGIEHPPCYEGWRFMLGCTRFRLDVLPADAVSSITNPRHRDWHEMCNGIGENLVAAGFTHHWHHEVPKVHHHQMALGHLGI
jgi:hypothetical protein